MTINEYNEIVKRVNRDSLERAVFIEIEKYCKDKGMEVFQIEYSKYIQMRDYLINLNKNGLLKRIDGSENIPEGIDRDSDRNQIIGTVILMMVFIIVANVSDIFTFFGYSAAVITAIVGFGTLSRVQDSNLISSGYNADYVQRYLRAHEDARINMDAYLTQAYLRSSQIKIVKDRINEGK